MKKLVTAFVLAMAVSTLGVTSTLAFHPSDGSTAMTQCDYLRAKYPARASNWPGCNVVDTVTYKTSGSVNARPTLRDMPRGTHDDSTSCMTKYPTVSICWGWQDHGDFDTWVIKLGAYVHYYIPAVTDWSYARPRNDPTANVFCTLSSSWGLSVAINQCGVLAVTDTDVLFGVQFTSSSPAFGPIPGTQVGWESFIRCSRAAGPGNYRSPQCTSPTPRIAV